MCNEKRKKCSENTHHILKIEKKKIMKETLENLKELREAIEAKVA